MELSLKKLGITDIPRRHGYSGSYPSQEPLACYHLGICDLEGYPPDNEPNYKKAVEYFQKAIKATGIDSALIPDALFALGVCYTKGWGVTANYQEAITWFQKAAKLGHKKAIEILSPMF